MIIDHHRASTSTCTDKRVDVNRCLNITADILFTTSQPFKYTAQHAAIRISDIARLRKEIASIRGGLNQTSGLRKAENGDAETKSSISALHRANLCKAPITRFPFTEIFVICCCVSSDDNWAVFYSVAGMRKGWWSRHLNKQKDVLVAVHGIYRSEQQVRISVINYFVLLIHEQNLSGSLSRLLQLTSIWRLSLLSAAFEQIFAESCARSWWYTDDSFCFSEFLKCTSF